LSAFRGWPEDAVTFFEGIEVDNSKRYWTANKDVYEAKVLAPMTALLTALAPEFGEGRVFRPYRDVRFSADKSPYKTNIAAHNDRGYITLSARSLGVGGGLHMPTSEQLGRFRHAVADDPSGPELVALVGALRRKKIEVGAHEVLKSAPRGFPADHPRIELLRYKGLTGWKEWPVGPWLGTTETKRRIVDFLHAIGPLQSWLDANVGN
jgi:uncharacterized protein (TIGR02453 family)